MLYIAISWLGKWTAGFTRGKLLSGGNGVHGFSRGSAEGGGRGYIFPKQIESWSSRGGKGEQGFSRGEAGKGGAVKS